MLTAVQPHPGIEQRLNSTRFSLFRYTENLIGVGKYLPHLLVSYLDLHPYCYYCGIRVTYDTATIEHLLPISTNKGLLRKPKVLACYYCNTERSNTELHRYLVSPRLIVNKNMAGFHFYKHSPQNAFEYVGKDIPKILYNPLLKEHEFGLLD